MAAKKMTIAWDRFKADVSLLATKIRHLGRPFDQIVAITRGGLVPAALLSHEFKVRNIDTVCVGSYLDGEQLAAETIFKGPGQIVERGARTLVVDDLVDSGKTAGFVKETMYPEGIVAVVYGKPFGLHSADLHAVEVPQDVWVIFPWENGLS
jgi:xanthine phosphoribosyltransferase